MTGPATLQQGRRTRMTLPFEKPIKLFCRVTSDFKERTHYIGEAYQNPQGYWARTDTGTYPCDSIEEALRLVVDHVQLGARGLRRIDPPPAVVSK